ncbi:MAG TPA: glycosyltransferase family 2 protein [Vicinamibacterales bacterium]|nr:glycosyltransferase family 2 protein [Vicinamibacterales bacterium]
MAQHISLQGGSDSMFDSGEIEVSIVMPCLNEHETVGVCVQKALHMLVQANIRGEVIVADNGSTDGSTDIAESFGSRVVPVHPRGYGAALMGGIRAARGRYVIIGDADDSYDFRDVPKFVHELRRGFDLVQGCRLPQGGGTIQPGAMPWSHRWLGNPLFSWLARWMFKTPIHDIYCGMRGFKKGLVEELELQCTGMEFATEMIIKASLFHLQIHEVPITLWPDARQSRLPHLRTFRDGWRTLRFFLIFSPRWLFWYSGWFLILGGLAGYAIALPGLTIAGVTFDVHTLVVASTALQFGFQSVVFAVLTTTYAIKHRFRPPSARVDRFFKIFSLERGAVAGLAAMVVGVGVILVTFVGWYRGGFGRLDYAATMRYVVPGATLVTLGASTILNSFFCSMLGIDRL